MMILTNAASQEESALAILNMAKGTGTPISARAMYVRTVEIISSILPIEPVLFRQSLGVLLVCALIDLLPGYFLGSMERYLVLVPGLLVILPPTVGLRGNTFGALASRVSSKMHLGVIEPHFLNNRALKDQIVATGTQLLLISAMIPLIGEIIGLMFGIEFAPLSVLLFISISAGVISGVLMFVISLGIILLAYRNGWDPDNVSAPIIASSGDILTIPILFLSAYISLNLPEDLVTTASLVAVVAIGIVCVFILVRYRREVRRILVGMFPIAFMAIVISTFSGIVLGASFDLYLKGTVFLILVPAFNGQGGSIGSILGSRLSSADYLGQDKVTFIPNHTARRSFLTLWIISLIVFSMMGFGAFLLGLVVGIDIPSFPKMSAMVIIGATGITLISSSIAYYVSYISLKIGLDPDNVVIPLLTSAMDVVGSGMLVIALLLVEAVL